MQISTQVAWLFLLALPVACISWTVTHEELFKEPRAYCTRKSQICSTLLQRKFFYLFTCEYCFSHYVVLFIVAITRYHLLLGGWRGYIIAYFSLVWIANAYMSLFGFIRTGLKVEKLDADIEKLKLERTKAKNPADISG